MVPSGRKWSPCQQLVAAVQGEFEEPHFRNRSSTWLYYRSSEATQMPIASRTFRVFVSSTFEDLIDERNALQRDVFPRLSRLCEAHGSRFQAIDLRWGVRDEAVLGQRMMEICLGEIERCKRTGIKPNF